MLHMINGLSAQMQELDIYQVFHPSLSRIIPAHLKVPLVQSPPTLRSRSYNPAHLKVSVHDSHLVKVLDGKCDFGAIEPGAFLGEYTLSRQVEEELSTVDILHHKTEPIVGLKRVVQ